MLVRRVLRIVCLPAGLKVSLGQINAPAFYFIEQFLIYLTYIRIISIRTESERAYKQRAIDEQHHGATTNEQLDYCSADSERTTLTAKTRYDISRS